MFIATSLVIAPNKTQLKRPSTDDKLQCIHITEYTYQYKIINYCTQNDMNEYQDNDTEEMKPDHPPEKKYYKYILLHIHLCKSLEKSTIQHL